MAIVAEQFDHVVGVDTHARSHTYCIVRCRTGAVVDAATFPTSKTGLARAMNWVQDRAGGELLAAVEGTSSYGTSVTAMLTELGVEVAEVRPATKATQATTGKSDTIDAEAAARDVLGKEVARLARPRRPGDRGALRVLLAARLLMDQQRTANRNALNALIRTTELGVDARRPLTNAQVRTIATWRIGRHEASTPAGVARREARRLATTVLEQTRLLADNHRQLDELVNETAPGLQDRPGLGPVTAAIIICAYSHKGRVRSEAAFAALGGVAPLPASSGNTTRHRLSRSGDRQLNRALDIIVRTRMSRDPQTKAYVARRRSEGRTNREIRRCLKRYVARTIYRHLEASMA
jgi:transposase